MRGSAGAIQRMKHDVRYFSGINGTALASHGSTAMQNRSSRQVVAGGSTYTGMKRNLVVAIRPNRSRGHVCGGTKRAQPSSVTRMLCSWPLFCVFILPSLPVAVGFVVDCGLGKAALGDGVAAFPLSRPRSTSPLSAAQSCKIHDAFLGWKRTQTLRRPLGHAAVRAMCAVSASAEPATGETDAVEKKINLKGLKQETERQILRQFKKLGKLEERKRKAAENGGGADEEEVALLLMEAQERLASLNKLEEMLKGLKSVQDAGFAAAWDLARHLDVKDGKPAPPPRAPKKPKGKPQAPRKPYFVYTSKDDIEIWVGRGARDNDVLSLQAAGCPGSHVVIRYTDEDPPEETVLDAACLALEFSKASGGKQGISLTRCRNVSKTPMAPAGQVLLRGDVRVIKMDLKVEKERLSRLLKTKENGT